MFRSITNRLYLVPKICLSDCRPLEIVMSYMEKNMISGFLESTMYKNYVKELIGTITVRGVAAATSCSR